MLAFYSTIFCLIVSFVFSSKTMKVKSIAQAVLAIMLSFLVFFLVPGAPLSQLIDPYTLSIVQDVLTNISTSGVSIISIIFYAILFLTILSLLEIVEYVKDQINEKKEKIIKKEVSSEFAIVKKHSFNEQKIYLLFCRLLN